MASFRKELRQEGVAIDAIQALEVDPLRPVAVPPGDFLEWIRKAPKGSVIVSFMGPPLLSPDQRRQLREIKPGIVAFCSGNLPGTINLRALFHQGLLHAAVVSRRNPLSPAAQRPGLPGWFDRYYLTLTVTNTDWVEGAPTGPSHPQSP